MDDAISSAYSEEFFLVIPGDFNIDLLNTHIKIFSPRSVRSDSQTTSLTLTTGVCEAGTKRRGYEQHEYSI